MDSLFDKLFLSTKHSESPIGKFTGYQNLLRNSNSLLQNIPSDYQQQLIEDSLFSADFKSADSSILQSHFGTIFHSTAPHIPKVTPCSNSIEEYRRLFNFSSLSLDSIYREDMEKRLSSLLQARKSSFSEQFMLLTDSSKTVNNDCISMESIKEGIRASKTDVLQKNMSKNLDFSIAAHKSPVLKNMAKNLDSSNTPLKNPPNEHFLVSFCDTTSFDLGKNKSPEVTPKSPSNEQLCVSVVDASSPNKKTHFNVTITKNYIQPLNTSKKIIKENCDLNLQMANRKTKELQKRSKKRRRRQKRGKSASANSKNPQCLKSPKHCDVINKSTNSPDKSNEVNNCDIMCDLSVSHDSKSVQIVLPDLSSFVVTIESGDDDSDWDTNNDTDWHNDDSEFQVSGLFVASFSSTETCPLFTYKSDDDKAYEKEQNLIHSKLQEINRTWNKSTKFLNNKPKSTAKVSFAPEEELEEICPVEMYDRKGEWEVYATERLRFRKRINEIEEILKPCFLPDHRAKVYSSLNKNIL